MSGVETEPVSVLSSLGTSRVREYSGLCGFGSWFDRAIWVINPLVLGVFVVRQPVQSITIEYSKLWT